LSNGVPVKITYDMKAVAEHNNGVVEINRVLLNNPPNNAETRRERQLFLAGVLWHELYHRTHTGDTEAQAEQATIEYFKTRTDILDATIKVLSEDTANSIFGKAFLDKLMQVMPSEQEEALKAIDEILAKTNITKEDLLNVPVEGEIEDARLRPVLNELRSLVVSNPQNAQAVLYLLGKRDVSDILDTAVAVTPIKGLTLKIVDAEALASKDAQEIVQILSSINTDKTKVVVVDFTGNNPLAVQAAAKLGIPVVNVERGSKLAEVKAAAAYKDITFAYSEVLTTVSNAAEWTYADTIRYILCTPNMTNAGLVAMYNALPVEVKEALKRADIDVETITHSQIRNTAVEPATYILEQWRKSNKVIEVAA